MRHGPVIERLSVDDLMSLVAGRGSLPLQVGAVLMLDTSLGLEPKRLQEALSRRLPAVPRLRQRLVQAPLGCGRPVWVDDPGFRLSDHLSVVGGQALHDPQGVLRLAAELLTTPLSRDRPLWAALLVTELDRDRAALIMVFHHVLADGMAGLAVLAGLVDGSAEVVDPLFPRPAPGRTSLMADAVGHRVASLGRLPAAVRRLAMGVGQLASTVRSHAIPCSLNRPTGSRRQFCLVQADLAGIYAFAHQNHATVNDVVLAAITAALHRLLIERGEHVPAFVVSVPFSARRQANAHDLGNQSGVVPLRLPATGAFETRLAEIARITRSAKGTQRGASTAVLGPVFRLLARVGLYQRFISHQRLIHTFVSNLSGPKDQLHLLGCPVIDVIPLSVATGNVTVSFSILSYAGTLTITINADPDTCSDFERLQETLQQEIDALSPTD